MHIEENDGSFLTDIENKEEEATYFQRVISNIIDWVIDLIFFIVLYLLIFRHLFSMLGSGKSYLTYFLIIIIMWAYRFSMLLLFEKTIGMAISKIKYLNEELLPLTNKQKLIATIVIRNKSIKFFKEKP